MPCSTIWVRTRLGSASSLSTLLTATTIGHLRRLGVVERLQRLRHHAVVGRHHQDGDVGDLRASGAHRGERLVAGRVDERDLAVAHVCLVGADVLGDPAELAGDHVGLADRVQELRLAVVDVAHDRDDRRARHQRASSTCPRRVSAASSSSMPMISSSRPSSSATNAIASSDRDVVAVAISPAMNRIFTISPGDLPSLSAIVCGVAPRTSCSTLEGASGSTGRRGPRRAASGRCVLAGRWEAAALAAGAGTGLGAGADGCGAAGRRGAAAATGARLDRRRRRGRLGRGLLVPLGFGRLGLGLARDGRGLQHLTALRRLGRLAARTHAGAARGPRARWMTRTSPRHPSAPASPAAPCW